MIGGLKLALPGYIAAGVFLWLWVGAEKAETEAIEACNTRTQAAARQAQEAARTVLAAAHAEELAERDRQLNRANNAVAQARVAAQAAQAGTEERDQRIRQLELEAETDDIPDSGECLNVFVPAGAIDGVLHAGSDRTAGDCGGTGAGAVCADSGGTDPGDPTARDFAPVTYSDVLILWGYDRDTIETLNGQLRAIRELSNENTETD